ncbi:STAS-domain containing protein [Andreprevotia sp. IGB-42]|uniref:STAS domain-containing protein n=1 Tax=Andreprevotia sp. IGB-42 TaxID=2497473 RepID=UPI001357475D|nr:STAS domain-containing protein [Andreprevotia sp. IGB-42]KAF0813992.1 STAS-domain containing protein [Andreprevotia sp. IGB-42]
MQATLTVNDGRALIELEGNFTYEAHREFKQTTTNAIAAPGITLIEIDFDKVGYMDSAALGMLLLLNERAAGRKVVLTNCRGTVRTVLDIANFSKIFEIR